ncbi:MAG TPA: hypothetical protein DEP69_01870, partial [Acidimicrobiaceae bacterium]|nr:hypothetical protein [Acidimicrobiaceae bacterium]
LALLWSDAEHWPTPNEVAAPGLWLERIEISADAADAGSVGGDAGSAGGDAGSAGGGENSAGGA